MSTGEGHDPRHDSPVLDDGEARLGNQTRMDDVVGVLWTVACAAVSCSCASCGRGCHSVPSISCHAIRV